MIAQKFSEIAQDLGFCTIYHGFAFLGGTLQKMGMICPILFAQNFHKLFFVVQINFHFLKV